MDAKEKEIIERKFKILEQYHVPQLNGELKTTSDRVAVYAAFSAMEEYSNRRIVEVLERLYNNANDVANDTVIDIYRNIEEIKKLLPTEK